MLNGLIIGGGISGLALAHWLGLTERPDGWEVWEGSDRLGGTLGTVHVEGHSIDWGPNGFLDREPLTSQLISEIGLENQLERADEHSRKRFILKHGRLHLAPRSPFGLFATTLLSPWQALRVCREPFIRPRLDDSDESIHDFAVRRLGRGAAKMLVDPIVTGLFGGVAADLSLRSCFPSLHEMETNHGSLFKAMIAVSSERRAERRNRKTAGGLGRLTSFEGGIGALTERLGERLQPIIRLNRKVVRLSRDNESWLAATSDGQTIRAKKILLACPSYRAAQLFKDFDQHLSVAFGAVPYAPIIVVTTGHRREDISHALDGFGFLVPRGQRLRILGSIWTSSIFTSRSPAGHVQFRTMLGGAGDPSVLDLHDDDILELLRRELGSIIGMKADPVMMRVYRWERGLPQYVLGHRERMTRLKRIVAGHPNLHFVGNAYQGVGLNDCVKMARTVADEIRAA